MSKQIRFNGEVHSFPDSFTDAQIAEALASVTAAEPTAPAEEKSVGGFLTNAVRSGGRLISDTAQGIAGLGKLALRAAHAQIDPMEQVRLGQDTVEFLQNAPPVIWGLLKDRYGSLEKIKETAYNDPAGVLADLSSVAGGATAVGRGASRVALRVAPKVAATATRVADAAATIERVTNPITQAARGVAAVAPKVADTVIAMTVRPTAAVKRMAGNGRPAKNADIAEAIKRAGAVTSEGAEKRIQITQAKVDDLVRPHEGSELVSGDAIAGDIMRHGVEEIQALDDIGVDTATAEALLKARADSLRGRGLFYDGPDAIAAKRKAQKRAYGTATRAEAFDQHLDKIVAQAFKRATDKAIDGVSDLHAKGQQQLIAKAALEAAEERSTGMSTIASILAAGGGLAAGNPLAGAATAALLKAFGSPMGGAATGIALDRVGRAAGVAATPAGRTAMTGRVNQQLLEELISRELAKEQK